MSISKPSWFFLHLIVLRFVYTLMARPPTHPSQRLPRQENHQGKERTGHELRFSGSTSALYQPSVTTTYYAAQLEFMPIYTSILAATPYTNHLLAMLPAERLPSELWLIIFELARESNNGPQHYCDYLTFPHLSLHLRRPSEHAFIIHLWPRAFRLICRHFNSLLKTPPTFFMKDAEAAIPVATRVLYILPQREPGQQACLQRVLADPSTCNRITLLNLPGCEGFIPSHPTYFDLLCDNAHSLPAVRTLTLGVRIPRPGAPPIPRFWWRLNNAFPLLTIFALFGGLVTTFPDPEVIFKRLEVVDWDLADHHPTLKFPALRHASFSSIYYHRLQYIAAQPYLESLLIRNLYEGAWFEWSYFPNLRLLGLPAQRIDAFPPLPPNHPLQHLYVFVSTRPRDDHNQHLFGYEVQLKWLKETTERMPTITRLSLWFDKRRDNHLHWISGYFREEDLELLCFTRRESHPRSYENGYHMVFERVKVKLQPENEAITSGELVGLRREFRVGWNKFIQSTCGRLRL